MYRDRQAEPRGFAQTFEQSKIVGARKLRQSGIAQESFEADHAAIGQFCHFERCCPESVRPKDRSR